GVLRVALCFDLAPYLFWQRYLTSKSKRARYYAGFETLWDADRIVCPSVATANDLGRFLAIARHKLHVVGAGVPGTFHPTSHARAAKVGLRDQIGQGEIVVAVIGDPMLG